MRIVKQGEFVILEKYEGDSKRVVLPEKVEGNPLTVIGAKAFLSCRDVEHLVLPDSVERIEDWAFAHMKNLKEIVIPAKKIIFGKKVFLGCQSLLQIGFENHQGIYEGIFYFLASMAVFMPDYPLEIELAGELQGQWEWLKKYDNILMKYLSRDDSYGFEPAFIGWFNIEDVDDQQDTFIRNQRKSKIMLCLQRLAYSEKLDQETKEAIITYLLGVRELVQEVFVEQPLYGNDVKYYKVWESIGGFNVLTARELLDRIPDADPEVRAYLIGCEFARSSAGGFFADLSL